MLRYSFMAISRSKKRMLEIVAILLVLYLVLGAAVFLFQRSMLYFPTHHTGSGKLTPWLDGQRTIGFCREVPNARTVWLMTHGNAGQASDREYALSRMSSQDSLYVLEYPGYGLREGRPCRESMNQAAAEAYRLLRSRNPNTPVCVLGESIGSGPACALALEKAPPDKIVLVVPFDTLANAASEVMWFFPVRLMVRDAWNNVEALKHYAGPVDIFAARNDTVIPFRRAETLAKQLPSAQFTPFAGGHNDWSLSDQVKIRR
jgi:uncharacterized protein